ncbi:hypothetical protein EON64_17980, partial [archaeon]
MHKKHIKVFDPTEVSGVVLLDSMSYMEMKVRQESTQHKQKELEDLKRCEILSIKDKKALDLQRRTESILKARELKASANKQLRDTEKEQRARQEAEKVAAAKSAQAVWE